ncbi:hypothetical protein DFJ67_5599 [Asanoa ferruginea]|uniref:Uncharacterized protein n=1 Tax=Asanoa ferruginea TaxID=53367 RepID=A0A3E0A083_9ACTN|nr:hypothetical protein DFJ67_5599 [Asanoa ferruginea]GIF52266.1 hypothetical protein Afe04nite_68050 [Asanoa ferruginea]
MAVVVACLAYANYAVWTGWAALPPDERGNGDWRVLAAAMGGLGCCFLVFVAPFAYLLRAIWRHVYIVRRNEQVRSRKWDGWNWTEPPKEE